MYANSAAYLSSSESSSPRPDTGLLFTSARAVQIIRRKVQGAHTPAAMDEYIVSRWGTKAWEISSFRNTAIDEEKEVHEYQGCY
jgi:hypothetical protein